MNFSKSGRKSRHARRRAHQGLSQTLVSDLVVYAVAGICMYRVKFLYAGQWSRGGLDFLPASVCDLGGRAWKWACADVVVIRHHLCRYLVDDGIDQLHDHHHPNAGPGHDHVSPADDHLGNVHHRNSASVCSAYIDGCRLYAIGRQNSRDRIFRARSTGGQQFDSCQWRRATDSLATPVLVLLASRRLHHDLASDGDGV